MGYLEEMAAIRQQRHQQEYAQRVNEIQTEYRSNVEMRDQAARENDVESWHYWDKLCEEGERDYLAHCPPQAPQMDPRLRNFALRNKSFFDRYGQRADQVLALADGYLTRPRVRHETNPARTGMGLQRYSPLYFSKLKDLLQMHGKDYGVQYDPSEERLDANQAAKLSGLSPRHYNQAAQVLQAQGRLGVD